MLSVSLASFEPSLERRLTLALVTPSEETFYADIFVQAIPMYTMAFAYEFPFCQLISRSVQEPGVPGHRD